MNKITTLTLAAAFTTAGTTASAAVLWDQQGYGTGSGGTWNHYDSTPIAPSTNQWFAVADVDTGAGWNIDSVTTYHRWSNDNFNVTQAKLHIFNKTGSLPAVGDDPIASTTVSVTSAPALVSPGVVAHVVTASGLNINLAAGDYWIGMTPLLEVPKFSTPAQTAHLASSVVGDPSGLFVTSTNDVNPAAFTAPSAIDQWVVLEESASGNDRDIAITINGTQIPEPTSLALLSLGGLLVARRRR